MFALLGLGQSTALLGTSHTQQPPWQMLPVSGHLGYRESRSCHQNRGKAVGGGGAPPLLFHHPFPEEWHFVVAISEPERQGVSGGDEASAFRQLPPAVFAAAADNRGHTVQ